MDIIGLYIEKRTNELENMLLSRVDELARLKSKLEEYKEVEEAGK